MVSSGPSPGNGVTVSAGGPDDETSWSSPIQPSSATSTKRSRSIAFAVVIRTLLIVVYLPGRSRYSTSEIYGTARTKCNVEMRQPRTVRDPAPMQRVNGNWYGARTHTMDRARAIDLGSPGHRISGIPA